MAYNWLTRKILVLSMICYPACQLRTTARGLFSTQDSCVFINTVRKEKTHFKQSKATYAGQVYLQQN